LIDGLARNLRDSLPNASFIGLTPSLPRSVGLRPALCAVHVGRRPPPPFTGTPIETTDANTRAVFGDYISIYDIQRAVADKATVPIYYESRVAKLGLNQSELPKIDEEFEAITEGEELTRKENRAVWGCREMDRAKRSRHGAGVEGRRLHQAQDEVGRARSSGREPEADR
jgi:type I restriction enzyme R subunit